jgi:hypothetical protein
VNRTKEKPPNVVLYGRHRPSIDLRSLILTRSGYAMTTVTNEDDLKESLEFGDSSFDLMILCSSIPASEREALHALAASSMIPVYQLGRLEEPDDFVAKVAQMLPVPTPS